MKDEKIKLKATKIVIEIPGQPELKLTMDQAKELKCLLASMFPNIMQYYPYSIPYIYPTSAPNPEITWTNNATTPTTSTTKLTLTEEVA